MSVFTRSYIISSVGLTVILQNKKEKKTQNFDSQCYHPLNEKL